MNAEHIVVIGGTRGLGRTVVSTLKREGYKLSVIARMKPEAVPEALASQDEDRVAYYAADLLNEASYLEVISTLINTRGNINGLIFLQRYRGLGDPWDGDLQVGLNATRKIIDLVKNKFVVDKLSNNSIIMVSSVAAQFANNSQPLSYSIVKAGLNKMVQYYSSELGAYGIRVNAVSPIGFMKEESKKYYLEENKSLNRMYEKIIPLGRMCTAQDVANVISLLCDRRAQFISGQNIIVDGGLSVRSHEVLAFDLKQHVASGRTSI